MTRTVARRRVAVEALGQGALGRSASGSHQTGLPPIRSAAACGDLQAADPGQLADRLLAGRVDVEHDDLVGQGQGGAELLGRSALVRE